MHPDRPGLLKDLSEKDVTYWMFGAPRRAYVLLDFMLRSALGWTDEGWELDIWFHLPRAALDLPPGVPGDIDILIVPRLFEDRFAEKTIAIEIKRAFNPTSKRGRGPNSLGITQTTGLLADGFPLVGVLQLVFVENEPRQKWGSIPLREIGAGTRIDDPPVGSMLVDHSVHFVPDRLEGRLLNAGLNDLCGYQIQTFETDETGSRVVSYSMGNSRSPKRNPNRSEKLLGLLRSFPHAPDLTIEMGKWGTRMSWRSKELAPSELDEDV